MHKLETHKTELKIRRMEYRTAHSMLAASMAKANSSIADEASRESAAASAQEAQQGQMEMARMRDRVRELEEQLAEQEAVSSQRLESARQEAYELGRMEAESRQAAAIQNAHHVLEQALKEFRGARDTYLAQVEQEVVRLALGIATRILHREAQMDPLLLAGAVRVALGQLADATEVRLRVPSAEYALWNEMVRLMPSLPLRPQLIADDTLDSSACILETQLGSVDLGVKAQLAEIERGFFDLLEHRGAEHRGTERREQAERREA